ncbi:MAG: TIGR04283 family arsenosugar biosynthesis glycosyltransferase [Thermodesulfobacteriota bacterium]
MKPGGAHILILARYPGPGKAKTRLIPVLGPEGAARLHRRMTEHTVTVARATRKAAEGEAPVDITVCYTGSSRKSFRAWLGTDLHYVPQSSGSLGGRMQKAFRMAFKSGSASALLVGSDVPGITPAILLQALEGLTHKDIALGPAADGGYYLIGMKVLHPSLFEAKEWGTDRVYAQTQQSIRDGGLTCADLPVLGDVDRPEDLAIIQNDPRFEEVFNGKSVVSVIIPTLNESDAIGALLERLQGAEAVECIVADGGSRDETCSIAARTGAEVLKVSGGRAMQQNAGAAAARGRILLFLHADTLPPEGYADKIRAALEDPSIAAGAFRFKTDDGSAAMRLVEWVTNLRSRVFQLPYGDQGIFLLKRVFDEMGRFPPLPIMEDFVLMRGLRARGRIITLSDAAVTSARRWQRLGVIRTTVMNQIMILGFLGRMPIQRLERLYRKNMSD